MATVILTVTEEFEFDLEELKAEFPELWADYDNDDSDPEDFVQECMDSLAMLTVLATHQPPFKSINTDFETDVQL